MRKPTHADHICKINSWQLGIEPRVTEIPIKNHWKTHFANGNCCGKKQTSAPRTEFKKTRKSKPQHPGDGDVKIGKRAKSKQAQNSEWPRHMTKIMHGESHPIETNQCKNKLRRPPLPPNFLPRRSVQPRDPQRHKCKKNRPWRKRNIACPDKYS